MTHKLVNSKTLYMLKHKIKKNIVESKVYIRIDSYLAAYET